MGRAIRARVVKKFLKFIGIERRVIEQKIPSVFPRLYAGLLFLDLPSVCPPIADRVRLAVPVCEAFHTAVPSEVALLRPKCKSNAFQAC
jgi:hypothetical protein